MRRALPGLLLALAAAALLSAAQTGRRGAFVALGGGPESPALLRAVLELAGGPESRVLLLSAGSGEPGRALAAYAAAFGRLGLKRPLEAVEISERPEPAAYAALAGADLVYVTGGDSARLVGALAESPLLGALVLAHERGAVLAGTSSGAVAWGAALTSAPEGEAGWEAAGPLRRAMPLEPELKVETHFRPETRLGRLLVGAQAARARFAAGVPERAALVVEPGGFRALGEGPVWLVTLRPGAAGPLPAGTLFRLAPGERLERAAAEREAEGPPGWRLPPGRWTSGADPSPPAEAGLAVCADRARAGALVERLDAERPTLALASASRVSLDATGLRALAGPTALLFEPLPGVGLRARPQRFRPLPPQATLTP